MDFTCAAEKIHRKREVVNNLNMFHSCTYHNAPQFFLTRHCKYSDPMEIVEQHPNKRWEKISSFLNYPPETATTSHTLNFFLLLRELNFFLLLTSPTSTFKWLLFKSLLIKKFEMRMMRSNETCTWASELIQLANDSLNCDQHNALDLMN
jgi:hypothetical protein